MAIQLANFTPGHLDWHRHRQLATPWSPPRAEPVRAKAQDADRDAAFVALQVAYRSHGGIARGNWLAGRLRRSGQGGYGELARRIVAGKLFSFDWHDDFWVPLFQFDPVLLSLRATPRRVLDELHGVLDGWEIAGWHVNPHPHLHGRRPLEVLDTDLHAVLAAARADGRCAAV